MGFRGKGVHPQSTLALHDQYVVYQILYGTTAHSLAKSCTCRKNPAPVRPLKLLYNFVLLYNTAESDPVTAGVKICVA